MLDIKEIKILGQYIMLRDAYLVLSMQSNYNILSLNELSEGENS